MQGKVVGGYTFPADATDAEIAEALKSVGVSAGKPLDPMKPVSSHGGQQSPGMPTVDDFGRDVLNEPKESLDAGRPFVAPALSAAAGAATGGSSWLAQALAQGAASGMGSAVRGGSGGEIAGNAALGGLVSGVGSGVSALAGNVARSAQAAQPAIKGTLGRAPTGRFLVASRATPAVPEGNAASLLEKAVPFGSKFAALGEMAGGTQSGMNTAIRVPAQAAQSTARKLPVISEALRAAILASLSSGR